MNRIPLLVPYMPTLPAIDGYLRRIDHNRHYTNFGPLCLEFESRLPALVSPRPDDLQLTTVSNCTVGLELALQAHGLAPGARVLVPAITFVATATAVLRVGMAPVIADVDPGCWALTPAIAEAALRDHAIDAVMPVATFGYRHDVGAWDAFTARTGIPVVIDAAGALGNQGVGATTDVVFSFHATKSLGAAEGGAVLSADHARVARIRRMSNFGIDTRIGMLSEVGTNAKMSEYHCALGLASLDMWDDIRSGRRDLAARYAGALAARLPALGLQDKAADGIYPLLAVLVPRGRTAVDASRALDAAGIDSRRWYCPPLHRHPALAAAACAGPLAVADDIGERILGLPFFIGMQDADIGRVVDALAAWMGE